MMKMMKRLNNLHVIRNMASVKTIISDGTMTHSHRRFSSHHTINQCYNTIIIGGGPMGSSIAYHLSKLNNNEKQRKNKILVIEKDPTYKLASSMLSAGGIRQQFSVAENVLMSCYGAEFLRNIKDLAINPQDIPDVQFHQNGYLFLGTTKERLTKNVEMQNQCGASWIKTYDPIELKSKFPWLNTDGLAIGSFSSKNEGYFDPWSFVAAMKKKALSLGVDYCDGEVVGASASITSASGKAGIASVNVRRGESIESFACENVVNASGAWAGKVHELLSSAASAASSTNGKDSYRIAPLPVKPRKRCIFLVHCPGTNPGSIVPPSTTPLVIDPDGTYFRPEGKGNRFICGISPPEDQDPDISEEDLRHVDHSLFEDVIWPSLCNRVPAFEELKVQSSWAGFYEYNTVDQNAIIGFHPDFSNVVLCNGFSGHGLQQSPAAGRAVSELITSGKFETIDLSRFSFERILNNKPIFEEGIV